MRRSMLFMPGNNPGNILNADVFGADSIILDLEDAVAFAEKDSARILTRNALSEMEFRNTEVIVRINSLQTPFWQKDLELIVPQKPDVIMPTKVSCGDDIKIISDYIGNIEKISGIEVGSIKLIPLLESALAIENAYQIATSDKRIVGLYLGAEDLSLDIKAKRSIEGAEIFYSRTRIVIAARAAGIDALDTPFISNINDLDAMRKDALVARQLGFSGKASIYPLHVRIINEVFSPSRAEYELSLEVLNVVERVKKQGKGVATLNGKLIDAPIITNARQTVEEYESIKRGALK